MHQERAARAVFSLTLREHWQIVHPAIVGAHFAAADDDQFRRRFGQCSSDARQIGVLSFLTPLLSTLALLWVRSEPPSLSVALAAAMIIGAAVLGSRAKVTQEIGR